MQVYCDRLTAGAMLALLALRRQGLSKVHVLDAAPGRRAAALLRAAGIEVEEAQFFTGDLRTPDGEAVYVAARRMATPLLFDAVDRLLAESPALHRANVSGGRNTVRLFLARFLWADLEPLVLRVLTARALSGRAACTVLLQQPRTFDPAVLRDAFPGTTLGFYGRVWGLPTALGLARRVLMSTLGREVRWMLEPRPQLPEPAAPGRPGLLVLQEDDLSMDRSMRSQPHWLFPGDAAPAFATYVLPRNRSLRLPTDHAALETAGVTVLDDRTLAATRRRQTELDRRLASDARAAALAALTAGAVRRAVALAAVWGLLTKARSLAAWCARFDVRAFLTGENYPVESDAMQLVAERTGITTLSYQYSNLAFSTPLMMTTADRLLLFSRDFAPLWRAFETAPGAAIETGYVFDGAFALVRARAAEAREQLRRAGAAFVLCYFDESVQEGKYGLIADDDHREELHALAQAIVDDPSLGLIVKSQFERNSPSRRYANDPIIARALATGRYLELRHGLHRNTVFPCEAALAADFAIGHIVGATAALEAALAGRRCALLNPYGMRSFHDAVYARSPIVIGSMRELLDAVARMRGGDPAFAALGDWGPILDAFDPWRDGQAAARLRSELDALFTATSHPAAGAA